MYYHISDFANIMLYKQILNTVTAPPYQRLSDLFLCQNGLKDRAAAMLFQAL
jgi:hypothetical protein